MAKVGRKTKYSKAYPKQAYIACKDGGFTDVKLAKLFNVSKTTLTTWKNKYPEFLASIKKGKDEFNVALAEDCLLKRVQGFKFTEETKELSGKADIITGEAKLITTKKVTKFIPPDPTSLIFFLKNRDRDRWQDRKHNVLETESIEDILKKAAERRKNRGSESSS